MMGPANVCAALAAACLLAACSGTRSKPLPHAPPTTASFQTTPCPQPNIPGFPDLDFPPGVQCGYLTVLENRAAWWSAPASSFKAIFAACAAQPACAAAYPHLEADFTATVNRLDRKPVVTQIKDESGAPVTVNIDGFAFAYTLIMTSERGDAAGIPKMIADSGST